MLRAQLEMLVAGIARHHGDPFEWRICIDTAPLLERSLARAAGLGWIGKNTCLINQEQGSWFFLGELLLSIPLGFDSPPPDRCGSCTRCIDACPTTAIVPNRDGTWSVDSRLCISYLTIEKRGEIPSDLANKIANHLFGCDICQDVCPWNRRAPFTTESSFEPLSFAPALREMASLSGEEFRALFRLSPVWRSKYEGFLRNVAIAMGNSGLPEMHEPLRKLASHPSATVAQAAVVALKMLQRTLCVTEESSAFPSTRFVVRCSSRHCSCCRIARITISSSDGFNHFYNNEYDQALAVFDRQIQDAPDDALAYNALAQTILYREMYRNGALESELVAGNNLFLHRSKMRDQPAGSEPL